MIWLPYILALVGTFVTSVLMADPCDPALHIELDEPFRSTGYEITSSTQTPLCDIHLFQGWYRFNSKAGGTIPTSCPNRFQCGTIVPIWMKGQLPTVQEGVASRQVCVSVNNNCCELSLNIQVKNCGQFYVYYLYPTPSCPISYCAGGEAPCPFGQWSPTMFPPGCKDAFPNIQNHPKIWAPKVDDDTRSFNLQCEVIFLDKDPEQAFEVTWIFDGVENPDINAEILTDPARIATLDGALLAGHMDKNVECRVRAYYNGNQEHKSPYLRSDPYYVGIQVDPAKLIVSEKDDAQEISVTSTLPILCNHDKQCCLTFQLDINGKSDAVIQNKCTYSLCAGDWNSTTNSATMEVAVLAKQDMVDDKDTALLLTFEQLNPLGLGPYMDIFIGYRPPQVQVVVPDSGTSRCSITGDPHFDGFDNSPYHLYVTGDFTAVQVDARDFEVQIRTWQCWSVTCICGIVVREGNNIIRIDQCDQIFGGGSTAPRITIPRPLGQGTIVKRRADGFRFGIYLLSGAQIQLDASNTWMNLFITLPGSDFGKARGLCGTNDGVRANEFTYPNGRFDNVCSDCIPKNFIEAWRAVPENSLFETVPELVPEEDAVKYCICTEKNGKHIATCDIRAKVPGTDPPCHGCPDVNPPVCPGCWQKNKRELQFEDTDIPDVPYVRRDLPPLDPNKQWPNSEGITEAQARQMCISAVGKSPLSSKGEEMQELYDSSIQSCMSDILFGETTEFLDSITEAFTAQTQEVLAKDPANYVYDTEGNTIMKPEYLDDICDLKCDKHGQCGQGGVCVCDDGWEGVNCHIQSGIGPQIEKLRSGPLCDKAERPCSKIFIDVSNIDLTDDLLCRVQPIDDQGNNQGQPIDTDVESFSAFRIACIVPNTTVSSQRYNISVTNDGSFFGNAITLRVYDSVCVECTETSCIDQPDACHIDDVCYLDGETNPDDPYEVCDASKDTTDWTILPKPTTEPPVKATSTTTAKPTTTEMIATGVPVTTDAATAEPETTNAVPTNNTAVPQDVSDYCRESKLDTGLYSHPYDCTKYIHCFVGQTHIKDCPAGLVFNPDIQVCVFPSSSEC